MILELEGYLIKPEDVSCVTPMFATVGPHALGEERYFRVFFFGGGQVILYDEASRDELVRAVESVVVKRSPSPAVFEAGPGWDKFVEHVGDLTARAIKDAVT